MKCFFQLIQAADGTRSEEMGCSRDDFSRLLARSVELHPEMADDLVLVLVDDLPSHNSEEVDAQGKKITVEEWSFSRAPLMKVSTFLERFPVKE